MFEHPKKQNAWITIQILHPTLVRLQRVRHPRSPTCMRWRSHLLAASPLAWPPLQLPLQHLEHTRLLLDVEGRASFMALDDRLCVFDLPVHFLPRTASRLVFKHIPAFRVSSWPSIFVCTSSRLHPSKTILLALQVALKRTH